VNSTPPKDPSTATPRLAYLLSQYPAVSHTFFLDEIAGLRGLGFTLETASINNPGNGRPLSHDEAAAAASTFYVRKAGALRALGITFKTLFTKPLVFFRGLAAALTGTGIDPYRIGYALCYFTEAMILADWLRTRDLRHLHIHFGGAVSTVGRIAARAAKIPYSLTIHGPEEFFDQKQLLLRQKVEQAAFTICISGYGRGQLMRITAPQHWPRLHVARLGVNSSLFAARKPRSIAVPVQILCVGRLVPSKGQRVLLEAAGILAARGHILHITLVGDGPDAAALKAFTTTLGLDGSVHFLGPLTHEATRIRLAEADVFVLPSFAEGIPVVLMEAMATQLACVSTWIAGIPELITNDVDGLLVPAGSPVELADALESLFVSPQLRARLGIAGRQRVLDAYEQSTNLAHTAALLREHISSTAR